MPGRLEGLKSLPLPAVLVGAGGRILDGNVPAAVFLQVPARRLRGEILARLTKAAGVAFDLADGTALVLFPEGGELEGLRQQVWHLSRLATLGRLVSSVVHEVNNALAGIAGYAQLVLEARIDGQVRQDLTRVHEEALRASRVTQNLLRFSRGSTGQKGPVQIADLLARCAEIKRRDLTLKSIDLELRIAPGLGEVEGDEALLFQVFLNLVSNAEQSIHAARPQGRIGVVARPVRGRVEVVVQDDGPGIPADVRSRIFEPFFTTRPAGQGTGLGLALCRDILRDHGGGIVLLPARGRGARFRVHLPLLKTAPAQAADRDRTRRGPRPLVHGAHVVVIEDEPGPREVVVRALQGHGNDVVTFERGDAALRYLLTEPVDLVISDVHRPGLSGIELFEALRAARPVLARRFLFLTGDTVSPQTAAFLARNALPHLAKPVEIQGLLRAAAGLLRGRPSQGELFTGRRSPEHSAGT